MTEPVWLSIVIPTCNRPQMLGVCLDALTVCLAQISSRGVEILVSDDSADDLTRDLLAAHYTWVTWIRGPRRGPAANRNTAVAASRGSWIIFTDDDCIPDSRWLAAFFKAMGGATGCSVLEGKTVADRERRRLDEEAPVNLSGGYLWSCNMAMTRDVFRRVGGFCETFPHAAMEDVDMRLRVLACGELFSFVPDAVVCHPYRPSKGLRFALKSGASYLQLVDRHPHLLGQSRWASFGLNLARRAWAVGRDVLRYRFRGGSFALGTFVVGTYFDVIARMRTAANPD